MRSSSLSLAILALFGHFAYGFSSKPKDPRTCCFFARQPAAVTATASGRPHVAVIMPSSSSRSASLSSSRMIVRGGGTAKAAAATSTTNDDDDDNDNNNTVFKVVASTWGTAGVVYILVKAIKRVLPIALEPFVESSSTPPLSTFQLGIYVLTCVWFAYVEGYKGFQTKFAPLVVVRSTTIRQWHHFVLAPLYSMGLFFATRKRLIVSWCVTLGVTGIVAIVKQLPYPWRNVVDAGVVVGLSWGTLSIVLIWIKSLYEGKPPENIDPALPTTTKKTQKPE